MEKKNTKILVPASFLASPVTRRTMFAGALGASAAALLAACSSGASASSAAALVSGDAVKREINLYTWGSYDDPKVLTDWGTITSDSYNSNEELIAKLVAASGTSGYDVVVPTHQYIPQMVQAGLLQPLDHAFLPNMSNIDSNYMNKSYDEGNKYSVPKAWGTTGYLYDTTKISRELTSWADFWDAMANEASGKTTLLEDMNEVAGAYFLSQGLPTNTTDEAALEAYRTFIVAQAKHVQKFNSYVSDDVAQSVPTLAMAWNGDARRGMLDNKDSSRYKWVLPSEGSTLFQDNWCIPVGAPNPSGAHDFINFVLDPAISFRELEYIGYNTAITGIEEKAKAAKLELLDMVFFSQKQVDNFHRLEITDANQTLSTIFSELQAAVG